MATLLLADDDPIVRYAFALLLRTNGYHVFEAPSNDAALALAKENPDAVITDVNMPGMTALELLEKLRKTNPDIGIIALSGGAMHQRPGLAESFAETGAANRVLQKPVRNDVLLAEVEAVLSGD